MSEETNWSKFGARRLGRRGMLRAAGVAASGGAALALVGCGDDDDDDDAEPTTDATEEPGGETTTSTTEATAEETEAPSTATAAPTEAPSGSNLGPAWDATWGDRLVIDEGTFFTTTDQTAGGTFNYNTEYAGTTFDPNAAVAGDFIIIRQVYQGLYNIQVNGALLLLAADEVEDIDELTWTAHVRDNVKFHPIDPVNGRNMTAEDVKFSFERAIANPRSFNGISNSFIETIEAVDTNTVRFTSKFPFSSRLEQNTVQIIAPETADVIDFNKVAIGSGPWMLQGEYDPTGVNNFLPHPEFFLPNHPFPEAMTYRHILDEAAHIAAYRSGQIDMIGRRLPKPIAEELEADDTIVSVNPYLGMGYVALNIATLPFNDPRICEAVSKAIDRKDLIDRVLFGEGGPTGPLPPVFGEMAMEQSVVDEFYNADDYEANLADAKALIEAAGGADALPEMDFFFPGDIQEYATAAPLIHQMLTNAGFKLNLSQSTLFGVILEKFYPGDFQIALFQQGEIEDVNTHLAAFGKNPAAFQNWGGGSNPDVDAAIAAVTLAFDIEERVQLTHEAQRKILDAYVLRIPLYHQLTYTVENARLKDFRPGGGVSKQNQSDYWIDA